MGVEVNDNFKNLDIGRSKKIKDGEKISILSFGSILDICKNVADELNASLIDMRFVKPIDKEIIINHAKKFSLIVTVEDNAVKGGAGSQVNEIIIEENIENISIINIGAPDKFFSHATREEQLESSGISEQEIVRKIKDFVKNNNLYDLNLSSNIK